MPENILNLGLKDYQRAYSKAERFVRKNDKLVFFGRFGEIKTPSLSDLDVLVCFKDQSFSSSRKEFLNFIRNDKILSYLHIHDPLIISESMIKYLPYLHTLYGLDLTYNPECRRIKLPGLEYGTLLNSIWTTFLIPVALRVLLAPESYNSRNKLLLLGNVSQSILNIDNDSKVLSETEKLRKKFVNNESTEKDIKTYFFYTLSKLFEKLSLPNFNISEKIQKTSYKINSKTSIALSPNGDNFYKINSKKIEILLNRELFGFFEEFYYLELRSSEENINIYKESAQEVYKISRELKVAYPFITPFSYHFFRNDFKFKMKKVILWFMK